ncbi:hypothetical protein DFH07DRAFT_358614 [Mycena maculata]|uniref:Uncharacterized protein n=1 Tax=Mycena maculata TaxID=230809 RepID=A0AAD7JLL1_9AGAR|nr:hypothetical protein DFH07DRAFT_358614 [Mycena maculata]
MPGRRFHRNHRSPTSEDNHKVVVGPKSLEDLHPQIRGEYLPQRRHRHSLVSAHGTSVAYEKGLLDPLGELSIEGWKTFCRIRVDIEKSWAGVAPSSMTRLSTTGNQIFYRKSIPGSNHTIVSTTFGGIAVRLYGHFHRITSKRPHLSYTRMVTSSSKEQTRMLSRFGRRPHTLSVRSLLFSLRPWSKRLLQDPVTTPLPIFARLPRFPLHPPNPLRGD